MLFVTAERFPTSRVDVAELFGIRIPALGHSIHWLTQPGAGCSGESPMVWSGGPVYLKARVNAKGVFGKIANVLLDLIGDARIMPLTRTNRYDVIQVRDRVCAAIWAILAAHSSRARFCYWMSYPFAEEDLYLAQARLVRFRLFYAMRGRLKALLLYRYILPRSDRIFVQSEQMREDVARAGIPRERMTVVPMAVDENRIIAARDARAPDGRSPVLVYLGTLFRVRRLDFLVRVLARVSTRYPKATLKFVGDGYADEDRQLIWREASRLAVEDRVTITGQLPAKEAGRHVETADICLSPFYPIPILLSTSPTKLVEYLAQGKVVVASDHPEQSKILEESGAGSSVPWDEQAFADRICALLGEPDVARERAAKGPDYVRRCRGYGMIAQQVDAVYRGLLRNPNP